MRYRLRHAVLALLLAVSAIAPAFAEPDGVAFATDRWVAITARGLTQNAAPVVQKSSPRETSIRGVRSEFLSGSTGICLPELASASHINDTTDRPPDLRAITARAARAPPPSL